MQLVFQVPEYTRAEISSELLVGAEILAMNKAGESCCFNELVERLANDRSRATVSRSIDILFDQGQIKAEWKRRPDGRWNRQLEVCGVAVPFFEHVASSIKSPAITATCGAYKDDFPPGCQQPPGHAGNHGDKVAV